MRRFWADILTTAAVALAASATLSVRAASAQDVDLSDLPAHPRFILKPEVIAAMQQEAQSGPKQTMFAEIKRRADGYLDGSLSYVSYRMVCLVVTGLAFDDPQYLAKAAENLAFAVETRGWDPGEHEYCYVYDWVYDYLTPAQRQAARQSALEHFNLGGQRTVYYNLEANEAADKGLVGLTFYGEGSSSENEFCQQLVDEWDGRLRGVREFAFPSGTAASRGGVIPTRNHTFPDGGYYKGNQYTQKDTHGIIAYLLAFSDCGLGDYWSFAREYLEDWPEYMEWIRRPDGLCSRMMTGSLYSIERRGLMGLSAIAGYYDEPVAQRYLLDQDWAIASSGGYNWGLPAILWRPVDPGPVPLPEYKFYGANGSTNVPGTSWSEKVFVRTGWTDDEDSDDVYFTFQAGDFFGDYWNFYQLGFEIYYRGALAIRSGYYLEGPHSFHYHARAISNNCVVVLDQSQSELGDIWGQDFLYNDPGRPQDIYEVSDDSAFDMADITKFDAGTTESGRPFYYSKGILKPASAYYYTNDTRKVAKQEREIVVDGRFFIVRDRVELSGGTNSVRWLLHTINEPVLESPNLLETTVAGHIATYSRTRYSAERTESTNGRDYDGKITVAPLIPADATLRKVGGTGYETWTDDGEGNGVNWDLDSDYYTDYNEVGQWRVETIAPTSLNTDFVHAIWVGRPGQTMPEATAIEDESVVGCEIDGVGVYVFARTDEFQDRIDYQFQGSLMMPHVIEGLLPQTLYAVSVAGQDRILRTSEVGGMTFDAAGPGVVTVRLADVASQ
ncbi:MAG: hypothetical protein H6682_09115 [Candidatus Eisenbacteria bacterium]|nr:hypothetical protein [Candidatus Eisenbacteria bacterium]